MKRTGGSTRHPRTLGALALDASRENPGFQWEPSSADEVFDLAIGQLAAYLKNGRTDKQTRLKCIQMGLRLAKTGGDAAKKAQFLELLGGKVESEVEVPSDAEDPGQGSGSDPVRAELGSEPSRS